MSDDHILTEALDGIFTVTLNRPDKLNAITPPMHMALAAAFDRFAADDGLHVCIVTGAGERAFCAGSDLTAFDAAAPYPKTGYAGIAERYDLAKPVIAAVNGLALGGGFELALACDLIVATEKAVFGLPEPKVGLFAIGGGVHRLVRQAGLKRAMGPLLTGRNIPAREGLEMGFVSEIAPASAMDAALQLASQIAANAPLAVRLTKALAAWGLDQPSLADALAGQSGHPLFEPWRHGRRYCRRAESICRKAQTRVEGALTRTVRGRNRVEGDEQEPSKAYRTWVVFILAMVYFFYMLDRSAINITQELIKQEFGLSDTQLGMLTGTLYGVSYAIAGIPLGWAVDRTNRKKLLAGLVSVWSGLTMLGGMSSSFFQLALTRIGVGAAESAGSPTAMSILSDLFPPDRRGAAAALFYSGAGFGGIVSNLAGGWIAQHYGWRGVFIAFGAPGLLLVIAMLLTIREPVRKTPMVKHKAGDAGKLRQTWQTMRYPGLAALYLATAFYMLSVTGVGVWTVPYLSRSFGLEIATIGYIMGVGAIFGVIGQIGVGFLFDWANRFGPRGPLMVVVAGTIIHAIAILVVLFSSSLTVVVVALFFGGATTSIQAAPTNAAISRIAPAATMGTAFALYAVISNVVGAGLGPLVVGALSDVLGGGAESLRTAMILVALIQLVAVFAYIRASRHFALAVERQEAGLG